MSCKRVKIITLMSLIMIFACLMILYFTHEDPNIINILRVHVNPIYSDIQSDIKYDLDASSERVILTDLRGCIYNTSHPNYDLNDCIDLKETLYQDHLYTETSDGWYKLSLPLYKNDLVSGFAIFEVSEEVLFRETFFYRKSTSLIGMIILIIILICYCSVLIFYQPKETFGNLKEGLIKFSKGEFVPLDIPSKSKYSDLYNYFNEAVEEMNYLLERQSRDEKKQRDFLVIVSHELKTPIATINAYIEGLLLGVAKDEKVKREYQEIIYEKMKLLSKQIDGLFDYAQEHSDRFKYHFKELYADAFFKDLFSHLPNDQRIHINNMLPGCMVNIDPVRLEQVVMNIYNNAVKHTLKDEAIYFEVYRQDAEVILEVKDSGSGIEPQDLPHIFEYYYQGENSKQNDYQGIGLGLAICKEIIDRHQGRIQVKSNLTVGTQFLIGIPIV